MTVERILSEKGRAVVTIEPDRTLAEAARLLTEKRIGAVVVTDKSHPVIAILFRFLVYPWIGRPSMEKSLARLKAKLEQS